MFKDIKKWLLWALDNQGGFGSSGSAGGTTQVNQTQQLSPEAAAAVKQRQDILNAALKGLGVNWNARTAGNPQASFNQQWQMGNMPAPPSQPPTAPPAPPMAPPSGIPPVSQPGSPDWPPPPQSPAP